MDPNPVFDVLLWCVQILTASVILFHAYIDLLSDIQQKHIPKQSSPSMSNSKSSPVVSLPEDKQEMPLRDDEKS